METIESADPKKAQKGGKSAAELEADLKQLMSLDVSGWVLIDFPRTIT